jgi:hypothetical protein
MTLSIFKSRPSPKPESPELNQVDLALVVDTTGSMGAFIEAARQHMVALLRALTAEAAIPLELQVGLVEYRDHPPQDNTFVFRVHELTPRLDQVQRGIAALKPTGGGDGPEAVYDGLRAACENLTWRVHSRRLAVLIGDAPPHGSERRGDAFPRGCPCGFTPDRTTALFEDTNVTLYAVGLTHSVAEIFGQLAQYTGGAYFAADRMEAAIQAVQRVLQVEFADLAFDEHVLQAYVALREHTIDALCETLSASRGRVAASLSRLGRRGLLESA